MEGVFGKVVVGKVIDESIKPVVDKVKKALAFGEILKEVKSILKIIGPFVHDMKESSAEWDRPKGENDKLIQLYEEGEKLIRKHSGAHWLVNDLIYRGKITAFYDSLGLYIKYHVPLQQLLQSQLKSGSGAASDSGQIELLGSEGMGGQSGACSAPKPPVFMVGFDIPLIKLKKMVLEGDASVVVVTAPGGCGKTALVLKLCQDPSVKGKFKGNIFYLKVSKVHNLKLMAGKLFEHNHQSVPEFKTDEDAINQLKQLLENQAQKAPVLLVLDDVWGGPDRVESDFPLHKFMEFDIPKCRILVTSRYEFPGVGSTYKLDLLDAKQAKKLFLHSALLTDEGKALDHVVDKILKRCSRFPLALIVVGGSRSGLPIDIWKSQLLEWSEGQSILDSEEDLLDCLQSSLASLKAKLKECFMDLGSFPDDKKIPVTALIDMWAELYKLDDNGVHAISNLHKLSLQNLLDMVVIRRDAMDEDEGWYDDNGFVLQHDILRDLAIRESSQEPMEERKRLFLELSGNKLPEWWSQENQPCIKARLLSISTDEMFYSSWCNIQAPEVEVLIINFQTKEKHYTLPEFMKQMVKLKVLAIANYGFSIPELANFSILGSLPSLKRIRLERVSIPTLCNSSNTMVELKNLEKMTLVMCKINEAFLNNNSAAQIPELMLPNLREMHLDSCNDLVGLPAWLCDLAQLRKLSISNCHKPSTLPAGMGRLKNLQVLRLHACRKLEKLPATIGSLQNLAFLDVSGCSRLRKLPEQMSQLCNLRKLNIGGCPRLMPPSRMDLEQLKVICDPKMAGHWEDHYNVIHSKIETTIDLTSLH